MKLISEEYARVLDRNETLRGSEYFSNKYNKDHAEWQMLGAVQSLHERSGRPFPTHACKGERPDFQLYSSGILERGLEVTRVIPRGYEAQRHHREMEEAGPNGPWSLPQEYPAYTEHWSWLRAAVMAKLSKPYIAACDLLVYFDVSIGDTVEPSLDFALAIRDEWLRCPDRDLGIPGLGKSGVHSLIVLSSGLDSLAIVYPEFLTL
jgi:hypothetical protein